MIVTSLNQFYLIILKKFSIFFFKLVSFCWTSFCFSLSIRWFWIWLKSKKCKKKKTWENQLSKIAHRLKCMHNTTSEKKTHVPGQTVGKPKSKWRNPMSQKSSKLFNNHRQNIDKGFFSFIFFFFGFECWMNVSYSQKKVFFLNRNAT